jgi:hypothetical protein
MGGKIFISYRRDDCQWSAGRLRDRLVLDFDPGQIFMDVDNIPPGVDFVREIERQVASCDVLLALIGRSWISSTDDQGNRRLDSPGDFVRIEIGTALRRNIRVVPVLIDGTLMPRSNQLPDRMKALVRRQALDLSHKSFKADSDRLIRALKAALEEAARERQLHPLEIRPRRRARTGPQWQEGNRLEAEQGEKERLEAARLEKERLEAERLEKERLEAARLEKERLEAARLEKERLEAARLEKERLEAARLERERLEAARLEKERLEPERLEKERLEAQRLEKERLEAQRRENLGQEAEIRRREEWLEFEQKERLDREAFTAVLHRSEQKEPVTRYRHLDALEARQQDKERPETQRQERERLEAQRREKLRQEAEQKEKERLEAPPQEKEPQEDRQQKTRHPVAKEWERERLQLEVRREEWLESQRKEREDRERFAAFLRTSQEKDTKSHSLS